MIESTLSLAHLASLFERMRGLLDAQRYLILLGPNQDGEFVVAQAHGIEADQVFLSEPFSLTILNRVCQLKRPFLSERESDLDFDSNTCLLAGIKSVVCVPILGTEGQVLGLAYADHRERSKAFDYTDLLNLQNLIKSLNAQPAPLPTRQPSRSQARTSTPWKGLDPVPLSALEQVQFLVQLATMMRAGIPLISGLESISSGDGGSRLGQAAHRVQRVVLLGHPLAQALQEQVRLPALVISMVHCAERSGQLSLTLDLLAGTLEKQRLRQLGLQASLLYPACLLALTLVMSLLVPAYLLKNQLEFYQAQSMALPGLSLALLRWGQFWSHPLSWMALVVLGGLGLGLASRHTDRLRELLQRGLDRLPGLGNLQRLYWEGRLLQCLHLLLSPGVEILESVRLAVDTSGSPLWVEEKATLLEDLRNGEPLSQALARTQLTQPSTPALLVAAEESGRMVDGLAWVVRLHEMTFDLALETLGKALEPLILVVMGIVVGLVTVASLLPSIHYIQQL